MATTFESFIGKQPIEIPLIQRDYVQGRGVTIEEQDKRETFVNKLISTLSSEESNVCHLEFIYGAANKKSPDGNAFVPLDGQQRLTTLYLLHWVVWKKSSKKTQEDYPLSIIKAFSYKTRLSSRSFCEHLMDNFLEYNGSLKKQIEKQPWFSEDWKYDPTINAMLSMIECMEKKLSVYDENTISKMLVKLCSEQNPISFDELNMADYDLTDSLYIKMNARGKQLTAFENWKSDFIKYLEEQFGDTEFDSADEQRKDYKTYKNYFSHSIEHEWTDIFWIYLKEEYLSKSAEERQDFYPSIDNMFMQLFHFFCFFQYYAEKKTEDFFKIPATEKRRLWQTKDFVDFFFNSLDSLHRIDHKTFFTELFYIDDKEIPSENKERKVRLFRTTDTNLFKLCVGNGPNMEITDMLLFYALLCYCNNHKTTFVDNNLKAYMRTIRNHFESKIQNLRTRTSIQLNLRVADFYIYKSEIEKFAVSGASLPNESDCLLEDCSITNGQITVFDTAKEKYGSEIVVKALQSFCELSTDDRVCVLIACGFRGTDLNGCMGRRRYFFGNDGRWNVLFVTDSKQLSNCFNKYTSEIMKKRNTKDIITEELAKHNDDLVYYMLKYEAFRQANKNEYHFAVTDTIDDVDWIALSSYSANPGTAYHTDPLAIAVEHRVKSLFPDLSKLFVLYKQYSGKMHFVIRKSENDWDWKFAMQSKRDGWHIDFGAEFISEEMKRSLKLTSYTDAKESLHFKAERRTEMDMVELGTKIIQGVCENIVSSK
ncbi:MAG: DUF262 domain-containing protein [Bacteroidales bacterium]|nr:DUF262 domain-containing protein [Bacteroidales bacterium]